MRNIHIYNPAAGEKNSQGKRGSTPNPVHYSHVTSGIDDARDYIKKCCLEDEETFFTVYGGDGTIYEAVNGIMQSGKSESVMLTCVPTGSGNDFVRNFPSAKKEYKLDLLQFNDMYAANMINIGFDCDVVDRSKALRENRLVSNSLSYILGLIPVLAGKFGINLEISLVNFDGRIEKFTGEFLLCAIANGSYCGGGFKAAPMAKLDDGLLDVVIVRKVTRRKFISVVSDYRSGKHIDPEKMEPVSRFSEFVVYRQCRSVSVTGMEKICADGEIINEKSVDVRVRPASLRFVYPPYETRDLNQ